MISIGDRNVEQQETLILPDKEVGKFLVGTPHLALKVEIQFHPEKKDGNMVSWTIMNGLLHIDFNGLDQNLGTSTKAPVKIGTTQMGITFGMLFFHHRVGTMNRLDLVLTSGGTYGY